MQRDYEYLLDIIEAAKTMQDYVAGKTKDLFYQDLLCQDAVNGTKTIKRNVTVHGILQISSLFVVYFAPSGLNNVTLGEPRALPWALLFCPFRAKAYVIILFIIHYHFALKELNIIAQGNALGQVPGHIYSPEGAK